MKRTLTHKTITLGRMLKKHLGSLPSYIYVWFSERSIPRHNPPPESFLNFYANRYSQVGQDGIIEELFKRLNISQGTFCEFGAWDGYHLSNARKLVEEEWTGVFIEGDALRFESLIRNYPSSQIVKINAWVGYQSSSKSSGTVLEKLLLQWVSPDFIENLDLLIIDVDGLDLEIALSSNVRPKIMLLEGGSSFVPTINAPFDLAKNNFQHPLDFIISEMQQTGYVPVCFHQDLFLVREDLANRVLQGIQIKTSKELFIESFHFLPRRERRYQMLKRLESTELRNFELKMVGSFHPNPIHNL